MLINPVDDTRIDSHFARVEIYEVQLTGERYLLLFSKALLFRFLFRLVLTAIKLFAEGDIGTIIGGRESLPG
jgi:hypothetical protein